jgi:hypothetical protein
MAYLSLNVLATAVLTPLQAPPSTPLTPFATTTSPGQAVHHRILCASIAIQLEAKIGGRGAGMVQEAGVGKWAEGQIYLAFPYPVIKMCVWTFMAVPLLATHTTSILDFATMCGFMEEWGRIGGSMGRVNFFHRKL